jgi:hypothetical protein
VMGITLSNYSAGVAKGEGAWLTNSTIRPNLAPRGQGTDRASARRNDFPCAC